MRNLAQALSDKGRFGDSQLVHINDEEYALLKAMGGSGTVNPHTGLREFWKVTEPGTWGDGKGFEGVGNFGMGGGSEDGGAGSGPSSSERSEGEDKPRERFIGGDNAFQTVSNVVSLVSNPIGYAVGRLADGWEPDFSGGGRGDRASRPPRPRPDGDGHSARAQAQFDSMERRGDGDRNDFDRMNRPTLAPDATRAAPALSDDPLSASYGYRRRSAFTSQIRGRELLEYSYDSGVPEITGTYNGNTRPYHIALTEQSAQAASFADQASAMVDDLVAGLPSDLADQLSGALSLVPTADGKIAVVAGQPDSGYVEATYESTDDGLTSAMGDIRAMLDYSNATGDVAIDGGFVGRLVSHSRWGGMGSDEISSELNAVIRELNTYQVGTRPYAKAMDTKDSLERELARRRHASTAVTSAYSRDALTERVASVADRIVRT